MSRACLLFALLISGLLVMSGCVGSRVAIPREPEFPQSLTNYDSMMAIIKEAADCPIATVTMEGKSVEGRDIPLMRFSHDDNPDNWKVFLIGTQHGNEPAGKEALIVLVRQIAANPGLLPRGTDLYILPLANPDGAEKNERRNAAGEDLNRDHLTLFQPETQLLHALQRRIRAHVTVDCHEYTRDSSRYVSQGVVRWPLIMLGGVNNPMIDEEIRAIASDWVEQANVAFEGTDITYAEYYVGGPPPEELRPSTPDADDARNGLGLDGNLSFIIESGVYRDARDENADLADRVRAYYRLLWFLVTNTDGRTQARLAIDRMRNGDSPRYIPTNFFWASNGLKVTEYPMRDIATGRTITVETPGFARDLIIKDALEKPRAYAISPEHATIYTTLLMRHGIPYEVSSGETKVSGQRARLIRLEEDFDPVYNRYDGRQVVEMLNEESLTLPAGTIMVSPEGLTGRRAALLLEPRMLYSIYQFEPFRTVALESEILPVVRIVGD